MILRTIYFIMFSPFSTLHRSFSSSHLPILFLSPLNKTKIKIKTNKHMKKQIKSLKKYGVHTPLFSYT